MTFPLYVHFMYLVQRTHETKRAEMCKMAVTIATLCFRVTSNVCEMTAMHTFVVIVA
jgi:hypothetical protein